MANPIKEHGRSLAHGWIGGFTWWLTTIGASSVSSYFTAHSASLSGLPAYKAIPIGAATFVIIAFGFYLLSLARSAWLRKVDNSSAPERQIAGESEVEKALVLSESRVHRLEGELNKLQIRFDDTEWLRKIFDDNKRQTFQFVRVIEYGLGGHALLDATAYLDVYVKLFNATLFELTIDEHLGGALSLNQKEFSQEARLRAYSGNWRYAHENTLVIRQMLSKEEAICILNSTSDDDELRFYHLGLKVKGNDEHSVGIEFQPSFLHEKVLCSVLTPAYPKLNMEIQEVKLETHYDFRKNLLESLIGSVLSVRLRFDNPRQQCVEVSNFKLLTAPQVQRITPAQKGELRERPNIWKTGGVSDNHAVLDNLNAGVIQAEQGIPHEGWLQFHIGDVHTQTLLGATPTIVIIATTGEEHKVKCPPLEITS